MRLKIEIFTRAWYEQTTSWLTCRRSTNWAILPQVGCHPILSISFEHGLRLQGWGSCCSFRHLKGLRQSIAYWPAPQAPFIWCVRKNVSYNFCLPFQPQVKGCAWGSIFSYSLYKFRCSPGLGPCSFSLSCVHERFTWCNLISASHVCWWFNPLLCFLQLF